MAVRNYFGIDFGTTNSAVVAITEDNGERLTEPRRIGEDERHPLPSYVAIDKTTGKIRTGLDARKTISGSDQYQVFSSIKTVIDENKEWKIAGHVWTPVDIAAELFKALKDNVQSKTAGMMKMEEAVIAVPVGFSSEKKNCVRKAAKKAGIITKMFVSEPTAAYCSRRNDLKKYKNVAVFDWGGGTLDVVVLRIDSDTITELSSSGMPLAGNDIDQKLAEKICLRVAKKTGQNFSYDDLSPEYQLRLRSACEQAKCNLADEEVATIQMARLGQFGRVLEKVDYDYFSLLIENEVKSAMECLLQSLADAGMNRETVDCIICEGGSSRLRPLQEAMLQYFEKEQLLFPRTAMWDIASGAAEVSSKEGSYALSRPLGIIQANGRFFPLLRAGQRVPTEQKTVRFAVSENTGEARFVFSDGESEQEQTFLEYFPVKLKRLKDGKGFSDESLEVSCYVDDDMVFRLKVHSNRMPDDVFRVWTYSQLTVVYRLEPARQDEVVITG